MQSNGEVEFALILTAGVGGAVALERSQTEVGQTNPTRDRECIYLN